MESSQPNKSPLFPIIVSGVSIIALVLIGRGEDFIRLEGIEGHIDPFALGAIQTVVKVVSVVFWMTLVVSVVRIAGRLLFRSRLAKAGQFELSSILRTVLSVTVYVVAFFIIFQTQFPGVQIAALFTGSTILGIVVGLALQETLGNLFAGIAMQADQPFQVGDVMTIGDGDCGVVETLTWRGIKIRTFDNRLLVVSNSALSKQTLEIAPKNNLNARHIRFSASGEIAPEVIAAAVVPKVEQCENVSSKQSPLIFPKTLNADSVEYELKYCIDDYTRCRETDGAVRKAIWHALRENGIPFTNKAEK